jgi:hypothetical protein
MQDCPTCGTRFDERQGPCPDCSDRGEETHRCPRCQEDYTGSDACPACGVLRLEMQCERHAERRAEGRCVICGQPLCGECSAGEGRAFLCEVHRGVTVIEGWAQVYSTTGEFEASLVRENLEAEGIDAQIYSQRDRIFSVDLGELSIVRVLVPVFAYQQAAELIREYTSAQGEVAFACAACGEAYDPGIEACTACGSPIP